MENSPPAVRNRSSQVSLFMSRINKDLDDHVMTKSDKYAFNFSHGKPNKIDGGEEMDFDWV